MEPGKAAMQKPLIGLTVMVLPEQLEGVIIDETYQTFLLQEAKGKKRRIMKANHQFVFIIDQKKTVMDGNKLLFRPEERIKRLA